MQLTERIVLVVVVVTLLAGGLLLYWQIQANRAEVQAAVAAGAYERPITTNSDTTDVDWQSVYPNTVPVFIGDAPVHASVADSLPERIKGLSGTPFLPDNVVKLFAFGVPGEHAIWMKDMNYALDIMWTNASGTIVHIEEQVSPDTFPTSFSSPEPAWFVVEAAAGFVASNTIVVGDQVTIPQ